MVRRKEREEREGGKDSMKEGEGGREWERETESPMKYLDTKAMG